MREKYRIGDVVEYAPFDPGKPQARYRCRVVGKLLAEVGLHPRLVIEILSGKNRGVKTRVYHNSEDLTRAEEGT